MQQSPTIRIASFDDYPAISVLERRYGLVPKKPDEWRHLWVNNPVYKVIPDWPIGWVLEHKDRVVGYLGNIPRAYEYDKRPIIAAAGHAMVVEMDYRGYSLSLLSQYYKQSNPSIFLNTTVNAVASKAYQVFRAQKVPVGIWNEARFWITGYRGFMTSVLQRKGIKLARGLSVPLSAAMFATDRLLGTTLRNHCHAVDINTYRHFDDRFDAFWCELKKKNGRRLLATRSKEILNWHFRYSLSEDRTWIVTAERQSSLLAYAVFCRQDNVHMQLRRARLVDFQTLNGNAELLVPMLAYALKQCRAKDIHMLEAIGFGHEKKELLERIAPHGRELSSWLYVYKSADEKLAETLRNPEVWDPCCFDGDSSL